MITTHICYTAACDVCGEEPEGDARFAGWWATDAAVLCDNRNPAHMAVAHEIDNELRATRSSDLAAFLEWLPQIWRDEFEIDQPKTFAAVMPGQTVIPIGA